MHYRRVVQQLVNEVETVSFGEEVISLGLFSENVEMYETWWEDEFDNRLDTSLANQLERRYRVEYLGEDENNVSL